MSMPSRADVVVVGGGPGGSVCAAHLARSGRSVVVLERATFPRFHLGESLLPQSLPVLEEIGILKAVEERFMLKYGARFHDDLQGRKDRFSFDGAWKGEMDHAFQVPRDEFDLLLLEHARASGAEVFFETTAKSIRFDEGGRAVGVEVASASGETSFIEARYVVDASGRDTLTARGGGTTKIEGLDQTALYAQFEGVPRQPGKLAGDIDIVLFPSGEAKRPNWFWMIPFKDGRTSVGAVVSRSWLRDRRAGLVADRLAGAAASEITNALFDVAVAESSTATELLAGAKRLWPRIEATADFSYRVRSISGDGWLAIGDASGFIDPLFSTGAHLAMTGGKLAADAIVKLLDAPSEERRLVDAWAAHVRAGAETFILAVRSFYAGPLVGYLFAEDKHAVLRRSITSLLAGDVFGDAIWLRDTKLRLDEMLASTTAG